MERLRQKTILGLGAGLLLFGLSNCDPVSIAPAKDRCFKEVTDRQNHVCMQDVDHFTLNIGEQQFPMDATFINMYDDKVWFVVSDGQYATLWKYDINKNIQEPLYTYVPQGGE
jgi:hypothetical protein